MTREKLVAEFQRAIDEEYTFVMIGVTVPSNIGGELEYILNSSENFADKLAYYSNAYDDNLVHKHNPAIRIESIYVFDSFEIASDPRTDV